MSTNKTEYMRDYYNKNRARIRAQQVKLRAENLAAYRERERGYHRKNREQILPKQRARWHAEKPKNAERRRLRKYLALGPGEYARRLASQCGCCAACGQKTKLVVDHCHVTELVRGLLCNPCNQVLGLVREDPVRLLSLVKYLAKW